nr:hypothetical protein [uncultured Roseovarius sp.]
MIELIFLACLGAPPENCEERSLVYTDVSPVACLMGAQPELARWVSTHPRWRVARWRCAYVRQDQKDA